MTAALCNDATCLAACSTSTDKQHERVCAPFRLVTQDKDLEVLGGVTAAELGEELDGAAQGQVGRSWQHRGASAVGAAETPRWQAEVDANPQLMGPV
jgi:hypothetical protein